MSVLDLPGREQPEVDYSNDPDNVTPVTAEAVKQTLVALTKKVKQFEEATENVAKAVELFDKHVDVSLREVRNQSLTTSMHLATAIDRGTNAAMSVERRVDEKLSDVRWKLRAVLVTCALLISAEVYSLAWRAKGRDIQYEILRTCSECSQSR